MGLSTFTDRRDAGRQLAAALEQKGIADPLVIGLPRGGVVVAAEVAEVLGADLDVIVVRKLGAPGQPELGLGAIAEGGVLLLNDSLMKQVRVTRDELQSVIDSENQELERRMNLYRGGREPIDAAGRRIILVDDGLATGGTMRAAIGALRELDVGPITVAVPVGARSTIDQLQSAVDLVVCLSTPRFMHAIGQSYDDFTQTSDSAVVALLAG